MQPLEGTTGAAQQGETAPVSRGPTPEELAARQQQRANQQRDAKFTPEQRARFAEIDKLAELARSEADWNYIRQLEHEAGRPVSERTSPYDEQAALDAVAKSTDYGTHRDGTPVTQQEHQAAVRELQQELDPKIAARREAHEQGLETKQAQIQENIAARDTAITEDVQRRIAEATPGEDGVVRVQMEGAASLGMGGSGASGAKAAKDRGPRIGIEDATRPELWGTLGHKQAGQEAAAISYGTEGPRTSDFAEHPTAQPARASELALQVAAQREASGVATLGTQGAVGKLEFKPQLGPNGEVTGYTVGVPVEVGGKKVVLEFPQGVDITSGMGPSRELTTQDSGRHRAQLTPEVAQQLKGNGQLMPGEQALAQPAESFAGKEVLGIGGGPTSIWAMEHALAGGAKSAEVAGSMPRPAPNSELGQRLTQIEAKIRKHVEAGTPVPPELTEQHHRIVGEHVQSQEQRLAQIDHDLASGTLDAKTVESLSQEKARIRGALDPFAGSRVDRNDASLNNPAIKQLQADVIRVEPIVEPGPNGQTQNRVKVTYADGTTRVVDQVIPSIGADPNAPGGINAMLKGMPEGLTLQPVIAEGRVVGLVSDPPGITISGAAMTGTLGTNMPKELLSRIPPDMRDAVISSIIDHANRAGVSDGSRGIVPGIENVGQNPALMQQMLSLPPEQQAAAREAWLQNYKKERQERFGGGNRFDDNTLGISR